MIHHLRRKYLLTLIAIAPLLLAGCGPTISDVDEKLNKLTDAAAKDEEIIDNKIQKLEEKTKEAENKISHLEQKISHLEYEISDLEQKIRNMER